MMQPFRIKPAMPVAAYKTYGVLSPTHSHFRIARCEEVECEANLKGWRTVCDTSTALGVKQAAYIEAKCERHFVLESSAGSMRTYMFPAGQQCFAEHKVSLERDPILVVRDGDWRGNPTGYRRTHVRPEDWLEDFGEHQQRLADEQEKGA